MTTKSKAKSPRSRENILNEKFLKSLRPTARKALAELPVPEKSWWADGVRFECQGSGKCCVSHGEYGYVYMNIEDRRRMAKFMKMSTASFTRKFCKKEEQFYYLKDGEGPACLFLNGKQCSVYEGRPTQCRTWPFWPEVMNAKDWTRDVAAFCPGVGKGRVWSAAEIQKLLVEQTLLEVSEQK